MLLNWLKKVQESVDEVSYFLKNKRYTDLSPMDITRHNCFHLMNLVAKISTICERDDHDLPASVEPIVREVIPDLVIYALQFANAFGIDLDEAYRVRADQTLHKYDGLEASQLPATSRGFAGEKAPQVCRYADATIQTENGQLRTVVYRLRGDERADSTVLVPAQHEHIAIVVGDVFGQTDVLCRVHSECWTGETLGSLMCDCHGQLAVALQAIQEVGRGVIVYLRQEGRGIGLGNKIRAYALQSQGADTVEANEALGFVADLRNYDVAASILADLGVASVALMTNNPDKLREVKQAGVAVTRRVPHWVPDHQYNRKYLAIKRQKLGHHA